MMSRCIFLLVFNFIIIMSFGQDVKWQAKRITDRQNQNESNTWINFRKEVLIEYLPTKALANIACDSKYWLWINGELVIFEGQLKRGPSPRDTYFDQVDITKFLRESTNSIAILVWYFGKDGFSHRSSGEAGLVFQCDALDLISDETWQSKIDLAFQKTFPPHPNFRLSESNVRFDARIGDFDWIKEEFNNNGFGKVKVLGEAQSEPWNNLVQRPIPFWTNHGVKAYINDTDIPEEGNDNWIRCKLPYNCHITPILDIDAPAGILIKIQTDNFDYMGLQVASVRAEYVTKDGPQQYESLGWMNGHVVKYFIPKGVKINSLSYRETGFGTDFTGYFRTSDKFYERLWQKAVRTLYVTMRDTYMDCPDRERAQWWGDMVNESGEAFYALSPAAATLTKKGILELINWQRDDGTIYSPIPQGNWNQELPGQMLASIGFYGFWNYYLNTGDTATIASVYDGVKRYLDVWKLKDDGTLMERKGDWYWGDWGKLIDKQLLFNAWYYLALKGYYEMSKVLDEKGEAEQTLHSLELFKTKFNSVFWDGRGYRTQEYNGTYDDRAQALAVVSGLADPNKYEELLDIFKTSYLASPYMEKYVLEALFVMNEPEFGLQRMKSRFQKMVDNSPWTTLYENFGGENNIAGSGTNNHAWSGGGLTILSQFVCGLEPVEAAWKKFRIKPQLGPLQFAETGNETIAGNVMVKISKVKDGMNVECLVPEGSEAEVWLPVNYLNVKVDGKLIKPLKKVDDYFTYSISFGTHQITAR